MTKFRDEPIDLNPEMERLFDDLDEKFRGSDPHTGRLIQYVVQVMCERGILAKGPNYRKGKYHDIR